MGVVRGRGERPPPILDVSPAPGGPQVVMHTPTTTGTARLLTETVAETCRTGGEPWHLIRRLACRRDAARLVTDAYRASDDPSMRFALVFVATHLRRHELVPMLVEAGASRPGRDETAMATARVACRALATLV
jgi:hypothetical protein